VPVEQGASFSSSSRQFFGYQFCALAILPSLLKAGCPCLFYQAAFSCLMDVMLEFRSVMLFIT
jgi:hypothetical protein